MTVSSELLGGYNVFLNDEVQVYEDTGEEGINECVQDVNIHWRGLGE
jgi:hypothetical protein